MNAYYFRKDKIAVLGAIKAQLPFSGGKYQLLFSWYEIPFPTDFLSFEFSATACEQIKYCQLAEISIKRQQKDTRKQKIAF